MAFNPQRVIVPVLRQVISRPRLAELLLGRDRWGNPLGDHRFSDPFPLMERIRADGVVVNRPSYQSWFVVGYDEIQTIVGHRHVSARRLIDEMMEVRPYSRLDARTQAFFRNWMLVDDEPDHGRLRRLVSRAFTPKRVADLEPLVSESAERLLVPLARRDRVDIATEFNARLPVNVILGMLGIPLEREQWLTDLAADIGLFFNPFDIWDPERLDRAVAELDAYIGDLADERRQNPQGDLLSALARAEDDESADGERRLSRDELVANVGLLAFAGFDTTASALGNSMLALYRNPDQRQLVMDDPQLWPNAVEELLRYDGPTALNQRLLTADMDVGGETIPAGSAVMLMMQAGNRDPRRYDQPGRLLLDRPDPSPLSFGHGIHYCLGAHLARLELRVALRVFLDHFGAYEVDESSITWRRSLAIRGPLTLALTPAR